MLKEIAGTRAYNILKKRKMETVEDVCQLFPSKYYDFSFINPLNTSRLDKNYAFVYASPEEKSSGFFNVHFCSFFQIYILFIAKYLKGGNKKWQMRKQPCNL